jgi:hypothetical protein
MIYPVADVEPKQPNAFTCPISEDYGKPPTKCGLVIDIRFDR